MKNQRTLSLVLNLLEYDSFKHLKVRKEINNWVNRMLSDNDGFYLLAHSIGVIGKTDYKFKNSPSVKYRSHIALSYPISHEQEHKHQVDELIKIFTFSRPLDSKTKRSYDFFISSRSKGIQGKRKNHFKTKEHHPFEDFF